MGVMNGGNTGGAPDGSGRMLVHRLRKQFGPVEAVRDLSFTVEPGRVTGFLGPNGAGKTTTLRIALGLVRPDDGEVTINGVRYEQLEHPARVVGAVLDSQGFHRGRRARAHLRCYTAAIGVPDQRADDVLALVGLTDAADRKVGGFSLGMRQRLALATALLGDPQVLVLDEPGAGLDPEGVAWLRGFLRSFAAAGRTVLVSSHQLAEVEQTVDHVVIISQGAQVFEGRIDQLGGGTHSRLLVQCADQVKLATALAQRGITDIQALPDGRLAVTGANSTTVGEIALAAGVAIYGIAEQRADLEQRFFELTSGQYQPRASYHPGNPLGVGPAGGPPIGPPEWSALAQSVPLTPPSDAQTAPPNHQQAAPPNPPSAEATPAPQQTAPPNHQTAPPSPPSAEATPAPEPRHADEGGPQR
jgi:ABC-2 type transport system ATP-binding protein